MQSRQGPTSQPNEPKGDNKASKLMADLTEHFHKEPEAALGTWSVDFRQGTFAPVRKEFPQKVKTGTSI